MQPLEQPQSSNSKQYITAQDFERRVSLEVLHELEVGRQHPLYLSDQQVLQCNSFEAHAVTNNRRSVKSWWNVRQVLPIFSHHLVVWYSRGCIGILLRGTWTHFTINTSLRPHLIQSHQIPELPTERLDIRAVWVTPQVEWILLLVKRDQLILLPADPSQWATVEPLLWGDCRIASEHVPVFLFQGRHQLILSILYRQATPSGLHPLLDYHVSARVRVRHVHTSHYYPFIWQVEENHAMTSKGILCLLHGRNTPIKGWALDTNPRVVNDNWIFNDDLEMLYRYELSCLDEIQCTLAKCNWECTIQPILELPRSEPLVYSRGLKSLEPDSIKYRMAFCNASCAENWILLHKASRWFSPELSVLNEYVRCTASELATDDYLARMWFQEYLTWMSLTLPLPLVLLHIIRGYSCANESMQALEPVARPPLKKKETHVQTRAPFLFNYTDSYVK